VALVTCSAVPTPWTAVAVFVVEFAEKFVDLVEFVVEFAEKFVDLVEFVEKFVDLVEFAWAAPWAAPWAVALQEHSS
jgi:hypothetical protein